MTDGFRASEGLLRPWEMGALALRALAARTFNLGTFSLGYDLPM